MKSFLVVAFLAASSFPALAYEPICRIKSCSLIKAAINIVGKDSFKSQANQRCGWTDRKYYETAQRCGFNY